MDTVASPVAGVAEGDLEQPTDKRLGEGMRDAKTVHVLSAARGYTHLTQHVASGDVSRGSGTVCDGLLHAARQPRPASGSVAA